MNDSSWSSSKFSSYCNCLRQYYYEYILTIDDTEFNSAFILKKLKNRFLIKNEIIKNVINQYFEDFLYGFENDSSYYYSEFIKKINSVLNCSDICFEKYYNIKYDLMRFIADARLVFENFFKSSPLQNILDFSSETWNYNTKSEETFFVYDNIKMYSIPDFILNSENSPCGFIWNTGQVPEEYSKYIPFYLYLKNLFYPILKFKLIIYNLKNNEFRQLYFSDNDINIYINKIKINIAEMSSVKFRTKSEYTMTDDKKKCNYCKFKKLCFNQE